MTDSALIWVILKPALRKKFRFSTIEKVQFIANKKQDKLELIGTGVLKDNSKFAVVKADHLKLSENEQYLASAEHEIKKDLKPTDVINIIFLTIDFISKTIKTEYGYTNEAGKKNIGELTIKEN